jgi:hypothetical protein
VICTAHEPKAGGTIAGTKAFVNNAPVTPHIEGEKDADHQLTGFRVSFEPKYRIGPTPKPFHVIARTVELPNPVNGYSTDLVFTMPDPVEAAAYRKARSACRSDVLEQLHKAEGLPVPIEDMATLLLGPDADSKKKLANMVANLKRHVQGKAGFVKADLADLAVRDRYGHIEDPIVFQLPGPKVRSEYSS